MSAVDLAPTVSDESAAFARHATQIGASNKNTSFSADNNERFCSGSRMFINLQ
jgi:hypothetical protein